MRTETKKSIGLETILEILQIAKSKANFQNTRGASRAYLCLDGIDIKQLNVIKKAMRILGYRYLGKAYGTCSSKAFYIGYDNFQGRAISTAQNMASALKNMGISASYDVVAD